VVPAENSPEYTIVFIALLSQICYDTGTFHGFFLFFHDDGQQDSRAGIEQLID
jgi:hypothetical protein